MTYDIKYIYEWPPKIRFAVIGLFGLIIFLIGALWDWSSINAKLDKSVTTENDLIQQLTVIYKNKTIAKADIAKLPQIEAMLKEWQSKLIPHDKVPEVMNDILKIGADDNIYFSLFNPEDEVADGVYEKIPIKIIAVGDYYHLSSFISQIANMPWLVVIGDLLVSNENKNDQLGSKLAQEANNKNLLTAEMTLFAFHQPTSKPNDKKPAQ
jgi:Tfp pilus assembly protein PilO